MRSKPPRKRTKPESPKDPQPEEAPNVAMELEILALKAKNADIIQNNTKLRHIIDEHVKQIRMQQQEIYLAESKANKLEVELNRIKEEFESCSPSFLRIMNMFIKNIKNGRNNSDMFNMSNFLGNGDNPESARGSGAITHAVKPHIVNGTVLNVNPTISLTRLNTSVAVDRPSTSFEEPYIEVTRRSNLNQVTAEDASDVSDEDIDWLAEDELQSDASPEQQHRRRLSNIHESMREDEEDRTFITTQRSSEIRILLPRLTDSNSPNGLPNMTRTSIEGNIGDNTNYNFETTIIEDTTRTKRGFLDDRLRVISDYVVTSPRASSTMLRSENAMIGDIRIPLHRLTDSNSPNNLPNMTRTSIEGSIGDNTNFSFETTVIEDAARLKRGGRVRISDYVVSSPRASSTMRMSANAMVEDPSPSVAWPTPSTTAIGDIEGSKMDVFADLRMNNASPEGDTPSRITKRKAYSEQESPKNSRRGKLPKRSLPHSFVSQRSESRKDVMAQIHAVPKVILERLSVSALTGTQSPRRTRSASKQNEENADPSENNNNVEEPKKKETKIEKKKETKTQKKRRKKSEDDDGVTEKVKEMQVRLSTYALPPTECPIQQQSAPIGRPHRAAKPSSLEECSLKKKMRRMI